MESEGSCLPMRAALPLSLPLMILVVAAGGLRSATACETKATHPAVVQYVVSADDAADMADDGARRIYDDGIWVGEWIAEFDGDASADRDAAAGLATLEDRVRGIAEARVGTRWSSADDARADFVATVERLKREALR